MNNPVLTYLLNRLKEPSTYAGIASFAVALKLIPNDPTLVQGVTTVGIAVAGMLAAIFPEGKTVIK